MNERKESHLVSLIDSSLERYGERTAIESQITGEKWTYNKLKDKLLRVSGSLSELGVKKGDKVMSILTDGPSALVANFAPWYIGATSVPTNEKLKTNDLYVDYIGVVKPKIIISDTEHIDEIKNYAGNIPVVSLEDIIRGNLLESKVNIKRDDISTILFSSGTSEKSERAFKAVILTHWNIYSNIIATQRLPRLVEEETGEQGIYLTGIAKQWHAFENMMRLSFLATGGKLHFSDIENFKNGKAAKINPHYMIMIPKIANEMLGKIKKDVAERGKLTNSLFNWFLKHSNKLHYENLNNDNFSSLNYNIDRLGDFIFYSKVREKLRETFGENKVYLIGGSASLPLETQLSFYSLGFPIYQGYGLTETSPVVSINLTDKYKFGSSGNPITGMDVLIADSDKVTKNRKIGELEDGSEGIIMVRGQSVFQGYLEDPERTEEAFLGDWFNTGDLGYVKGTRENKFLYVNRRKKSEIVLSNGENYAPEPIEDIYSSKGLEIVVVGNNQKKLGALVLMNGECSKEYLHNKVYKMFLNSKEEVGVDLKDRFVVIEDYSRFITPTMKIKRDALADSYSSEIERICNT